MAMRKTPISQYSSDEIGIAVYDLGDLVDADSDVTLQIVRDADAFEVVPTGTVATHDGLGLYSFRVHGQATQLQGGYTVTWSYSVGLEPYIFVSTYWITEEQPNWDALDANQRVLVENVYHRVSDGYDSSTDKGGGGPYLWELPQSNFGYETIARLCRTEAINYINMAKPKAFQPPFNFGRDVPNPFPAAYYNLLEKAGFWALAKHLQRSYLEQPLAVGITTARLDRRDYFDRWGFIATQEKEELDEEVRMMKRNYLYGVKTRASLLAGGIFPISYLDPARPRWPYVVARF